MAEQLAASWPFIEGMLADGLSLVPVREKRETKGNVIREAKTPYGFWKKYQSERIAKNELWAQMEANDTTSVAFICGEISGNLECIDVDVKYKSGFDAILFSDLKQFFPELFDRLRIHRTPSGGFHILYRVKDMRIPGNAKLSRRHATEEELKVNPKEKQKCFVETRGEGGYAVAPPSLGYSVLQNRSIPVISIVERETLIALCKTYDEIVDIEKPSQPKHQDREYYDVNPFADFNLNVEGENVLLEFGWKLALQNNRFAWYTRPGKDRGISASFNKSKRVYYIFTSSTEFDGSKGYLPSTALAMLKYDGDKKKTFAYLVSKGYGKIKSSVERRIAEKAALNPYASLPANISTEAREKYSEIHAQVVERYPYGIFWEDSGDDKADAYKINRERLLRVCYGLGYRLHKGSVYQINGYLVYNRTDREFFDGLKAYIAEEEEATYEAVCSVYEAFIQRSGKFTIERLPILEEGRMLKSSKGVAYKFYQNCYVKVTAGGVETFDYENAPFLFFASQQQPREFTIGPESGCYVEFLRLALDRTDQYIHQCIGYLAHEYKDEEGGYIIVLSEMVEDPKDGGGSGKNIFSALLKHTISWKSVPASQIQFTEKFLNSWNGERVLSISDLKKNFDFEFLKDLSTNDGILKKLFKDEVSVQSSEMPKLILSTNFAANISDGGLKRRIRSLEFTDFFTRCGGIRKHFNKMFTSEWTDEDWSGFDNFIINSIHVFLKSDGHIGEVDLTASGWNKQFSMMYGQQTFQFIAENIDGWIRQQHVPISEFNSQYNAFCIENNVGKTYVMTAQRLNLALKSYCQHIGLKEFNQSCTLSSPVGGSQKCKLFLSDGAEKDGEELPF